jgi:DNA polymerase III subunit gamma/tau
MTYQIIARKWRPRTFDEVVYQDHISTTLQNSIRQDRISHAYIFSGPRGVGKTTMARILARALNCKEGPTPLPCGVCENCSEIRDGMAFDVVEIDGASNTGVDNIRELRENVNSAPFKARYKVYIIDEVHMLSKSAFNALLKTLEEPPPHVVFIFATTEIHQIPDTILSRCQKYFFKKISIGAIVDHLKVIISSENYSIDTSALYPIARSSGGSMRDAQSILDQVLSFSDGSIKEEDILSLLGLVPLDSYCSLLQCIHEGDARAVLDEIERVFTIGMDIPHYISGLSDVARALRLIHHGVDVDSLMGYSDEEFSVLQKTLALYQDEELSMIFKLLSDLQHELRYAVNEQVLVEMFLLDIIAAVKNPTLAEILQKIEEFSDSKKSITDTASQDKKKSTPVTEPAGNGKSIQDSADAKDADPAFVMSQWDELLSTIKEEKSYLFFKLANARVLFNRGTLTIEFTGKGDTDYYRRMLDNRDINFIKDELGKRIRRNIAVHVKAGERKEDNNTEPVIDDAPPPEAIMLRDTEVLEKPTNPMVDKIVTIFEGEIVDKGENE